MLMAQFEIRAEWWGKALRFVDQTIEAADACEALNFATPSGYRIGEFEECRITIRKVEKQQEPTF